MPQIVREFMKEFHVIKIKALRSKFDVIGKNLQ
jgi:hypothetical protein